ncbi:flagellar basal body protein, partial [Oryzihumus sp.]
MSGFSSLGLGARALSAAQRALDVTGQNISNA